MAQTSKVSGIINVNGVPESRTVRAFGYDPTDHDLDSETVNVSKSLGHSISNPITGEYTIDLLGGYSSDVFVVAFDEYGLSFVPETPLSVGQRVHPTTPNGHVYECDGAGILPSEEPTWSIGTEASQLYGTASLIARQFYRPVVHGPIVPEVTGVPSSSWTPEDLLKKGDIGCWFDFGDITTLFKDYEGRILVTNDGDRVQLVKDKSGSGLNAYNSVSSKSPIYRTDGTKSWLEFNGVEYLQVGPVQFSEAWTAAAAFETTTLATTQSIIDSDTSGFPADHTIRQAQLLRIRTDGSVDCVAFEEGAGAHTVNGGAIISINTPVVAMSSAGGNQVSMAINGAYGTSTATGPLSAKFNNISIGKRFAAGDQSFDGKIYGVFINVNRSTTVEERVNISDFLTDSVAI